MTAHPFEEAAAPPARNACAPVVQRRVESVREAVILCGGAGTRIRALFPDLPKALVPLAGRPFLEWQLEWLAAAGVRRVVLAAGYRADRLAAWRDAWARRPNAAALTIEMVVEPRPLGTGGALRHAAGHMEGETVLALNGDSLAPRLDFHALEAEWRFFSKAWKKVRPSLPSLGTVGAADPPALETRGAALAAIPMEDAGRFGTVEFGPADRVTAFREKAACVAGWVNAGVYLIDWGLLRALPPDIPFSLENDLFPALAQAGALLAVRSEPPLLDIGTPEGRATAERALTGGAHFERR